MYSLMSTRISAVPVGEEELGQGPRQLGLADARGPGEDERSDRAPRVLQPRAAAADGAADRLDRVVLTDHALVELVLHVDETLVSASGKDPGDGNTGPPADDEGDILDRSRDGAHCAPPPTPPGLADLEQLPLVVAQLRRTLEVLILDRLLPCGRRSRSSSP
jgi:hypothetical protein